MESLTNLAGLKSLEEAHHFLEELQAGMDSILIQGDNFDELWCMHDWYSYILELWIRKARQCYGQFGGEWIPIMNTWHHIIEATVEFVVTYGCTSDRPSRSSVQKKPDRRILESRVFIHDPKGVPILERPDRHNWNTSLLDSGKPFRAMVANVRSLVESNCSKEELETQRRCGISSMEFLEYVEELEEKVEELIGFLPAEETDDLYLDTSHSLDWALLMLEFKDDIRYLQLLQKLSSKWLLNKSDWLPYFDRKYHELVQKLFGKIIAANFLRGCCGMSTYNTKDFAKIIALGADIRGEVYGRKDCCLWAAARSTCPLDIFKALVRAGAPYTKAACEPNYPSPLQAAVEADRTDIIAFLLSSQLHSLKIDINDKDSSGPKALHIAATKCNKKAVSLLLQHPDIEADTMSDGYTPFLLAVKANEDSRDKRVVVKTLIDSKRVDPFQITERGENALHLAADRRDPTISIMLKHVNRINAQDKMGETPLHRAVRANSKQNVDILLRHGADPTMTNGHGDTPLQLACAKRHVGPMEALLRLPRSLVNQWPDAESRGPGCSYSPIRRILSDLYRIQWGTQIDDSRRALKLVLTAGADLEARDSRGQSVLSDMISMHNNDIILDLLHAGADVNSQDDEGNTPLHYLVRYNPFRYMRFELLLKWGANPDIKNNDNKTPIAASSEPHCAEEWAKDLAAIVRRHKAGIADAQEKKKGYTIAAKPQSSRHQDAKKRGLKYMSNPFSVLMEDEES